MNYTADALIAKLKDEENIIISARTLNYYAYDKKMFPCLKKGKCSFTDEEYELLKRIAYLKDKTSMSLDQIKECITDDDKYTEQVNSIITDSVLRSQTYSGGITNSQNSNFTFATSNLQIATKDEEFAPQPIGDFLYQAFKNDANSNSVPIDSSAISHGTATNSASLNAMQVSCDTDCYCNTTLDESVGVTYCNTAHSCIPQQISPMPKETAKKNETTVRINKDVTITVSSDVSKERLIEIINFINSK